MKKNKVLIIELLFIIFVLNIPHLSAKVIPIEHFVKHGDYLNMKVSPDGKHIAARVRIKSDIILLFIRREDMKIISHVNPGKGNSIHTITWVNNERVVYEVAVKSLSDTDRPIATGELLGINIDGSHNNLLYGFRTGYKQERISSKSKASSKADHDILDILENDEKNILIVEYPWGSSKKEKHSIISKLNIYSAAKRKIERLPHNRARALADKNGEVKFIIWDDKDAYTRAAFRKNLKSKWQELTSVFNVKKRMVLKPVIVNSESNKAYLKGVFGKDRLETIFELDLETGGLIQLFKGLKADIEEWVVDERKPVIGISRPGRENYHYLNINNPMIKTHKMLVNAFKGQNISITSETKDKQTLLIKVYSDVNPGEYYLFNRKTNKADFVWANKSWIDPRDMQPMQPFKITARDGLKLNGYLTLPKESKKMQQDKLPMVVIVHGGPYGIRDSWEFNHEVQLLVNRGYVVMQVNFRGSGGYGDSFEVAGYKEWGGKMIDDMTDATQWVINQGKVDANRICIYGGSYGGYAALMSTIREPDLYQCAVGYVGIYDLNLMYSEGDTRSSWNGNSYLEIIIGQDKKQLKKFSPVFHANKIKAEVMLVQGEQDERAPPIHTEKMRDVLKKVGKRVTWLNYKKSGHGIWDVKNRKNFYSEMLKFLDKNIGASRESVK